MHNSCMQVKCPFPFGWFVYAPANTKATTITSNLNHLMSSSLVAVHYSSRLIAAIHPSEIVWCCLSEPLTGAQSFNCTCSQSHTLVLHIVNLQEYIKVAQRMQWWRVDPWICFKIKKLYACWLLPETKIFILLRTYASTILLQRNSFIC